MFDLWGTQTWAFNVRIIYKQTDSQRFGICCIINNNAKNERKNEEEEEGEVKYFNGIWDYMVKI